jgi:hypothetical protein
LRGHQQAPAKGIFPVSFLKFVLDVEHVERLLRLFIRELNNRQFSIVSMSIPGAQTPWAEASFEEREAIHQKYRDYTHGMLWFLKSDPRVLEHIRDEMAPYGFCKDEWTDNAAELDRIYDEQVKLHQSMAEKLSYPHD